MPPDALAKLLAAAIRAPELPGALCAGHAPAWDERDTDGPPDRWEPEAAAQQRHAAAIAACHRCPALAFCRTWLDNLPTNRRPTGVVAGRLITNRRNP